MRKLLLVLLSLVIINLSGCYSILSKIRILTVQQGNVIEQSDINKLHAGMTKQQVREILGDPILMNTFDENRWEYTYVLDKPRTKIIQKNLTVIFNNNGRLIRYIAS